MKKIVTILLCTLLMCAVLSACGSPETPSGTQGTTPNNGATEAPSTTATEPGNAEPTADTYAYVLKGVTVAVDAEMAPLVEQLGEATDYFESESCAFQGMDKVYTYGSVVIRTYPEAGVDYVLSIELKDDTVTTPEGISIGASREDVIAAYGDASEENDIALIYKKGDCVLSFILENGKVSGITYTSTVL